MTFIANLHELFGLSVDCTDEELRRAYRHALLQHHPDLNPHRVEAATTKTQELTGAYAALKEWRQQGRDPAALQGQEFWQMASQPARVVVYRVSHVDLEDIARRKHSFRQAWQAFRQNPSDAFRALLLVHAAFNAERHDVVHDLLRNPILIDAACLLLDIAERASAFETLCRWADVLYEDGLVQESIRILEDAFSAWLKLD